MMYDRMYVYAYGTCVHTSYIMYVSVHVVYAYITCSVIRILLCTYSMHTWCKRTRVRVVCNVCT